jgi:hypothetical protein
MGVDCVSIDVSKADVTADVAVGERFAIHAEQVHPRGVELAHVDSVLNGGWQFSF